MRPWRLFSVNKDRFEACARERIKFSEGRAATFSGTGELKACTRHADLVFVSLCYLRSGRERAEQSFLCFEEYNSPSYFPNTANDLHEKIKLFRNGP